MFTKILDLLFEYMIEYRYSIIIFVLFIVSKLRKHHDSQTKLWPL